MEYCSSNMQENSSDIQENFCQILNSQQDSLEIKLSKIKSYFMCLKMYQRTDNFNTSLRDFMFSQLIEPTNHKILLELSKNSFTYFSIFTSDQKLKLEICCRKPKTIVLNKISKFIINKKFFPQRKQKNFNNHRRKSILKRLNNKKDVLECRICV
jgi:hypothetical protein